MTRTRVGALAVAALLLLIVAALATRTSSPRIPARSSEARPTLLLLTTLPIMFGEEFSLQQKGSPALTALNRRYRVVPISVTEPSELAKGKLLLMAQPLAQPAEALVALDQWVRSGGRLLLLADPMLEWHSDRPLGDPLRPPPMFMDTGLLLHWGLRLDAPDERGSKTLRMGQYDVQTASPGRLAGSCLVSSNRLIAHCRIGKGLVTIIADADFLDVENPAGSASNNLEALMVQLAALERGRFAS